MSKDAQKELDVIVGMLKRFKQTHGGRLTTKARNQLNTCRNTLQDIREDGFRPEKRTKQKPTEKELLEGIMKRSENF
jgi:hypothetical protein